eukprot:scaffold89320_cov66-Phaeocystis_antarctica.AAC.2
MKLKFWHGRSSTWPLPSAQYQVSIARRNCRERCTTGSAAAHWDVAARCVGLWRRAGVGWQHLADDGSGRALADELASWLGALRGGLRAHAREQAGEEHEQRQETRHRGNHVGTAREPVRQRCDRGLNGATKAETYSLRNGSVLVNPPLTNIPQL